MSDSRDEHETDANTDSYVSIKALVLVMRERDEARRDVQRLTAERDAAREERDEVVRISNKLIQERDSARRKVCWWTEIHYHHHLTPEKIALRYGWDCFKEDGKPCQ